MRDVKSAIARLEATTTRIEAMLTATLPHLATKAEVAELRGDLTGKVVDLRGDITGKVVELRADIAAALAEKPGKTYMWGILAALLTAYACGLAALAVLK